MQDAKVRLKLRKVGFAVGEDVAGRAGRARPEDIVIVWKVGEEEAEEEACRCG